MARKRKITHRYITDFIKRNVIKPDYGKEIKLSKALFEKYPIEVWDSVDLKVKSLLVFYSDYGQDYLKRILIGLKYEPESKPQRLELSTEKHGEDAIIKKIPKTLSEFLE